MHAFLHTVASGGTLSQDEAEAALDLMMRGEATPEEMAGLLMALRARGESLDELVGFTRAMRRHALSVHLDDEHAIDVCGTGGDASGTFNISTVVAIVCAGAGVTVAKHGNRSVSSKSGSADVLEALGVNVGLGPEGVEQCLRDVGLAFLFAPTFHPAVRHVMPVRRALGVRTAFNMLGPLCNPAGVRRQLVGAFSQEAAQKMCAILAELGSAHVIAAHGQDGLDEVSLTAPTAMYEFHPSLQHIRTFRVEPEMHGLGRFTLEALKGGTADENAEIARYILDGNMGPYRAAVVLNAAYALHVSGRFADLDACFDAVRESLDSGKAKAKLAALAEASHSVRTNA
ncbi:MAG: anthranilate phosphoribosyltransferase [Bacteroidota bacterium]